MKRFPLRMIVLCFLGGFVFSLPKGSCWKQQHKKNFPLTNLLKSNSLFFRFGEASIDAKTGQYGNKYTAWLRKRKSGSWVRALDVNEKGKETGDWTFLTASGNSAEAVISSIVALMKGKKILTEDDAGKKVEVFVPSHIDKHLERMKWTDFEPFVSHEMSRSNGRPYSPSSRSSTRGFPSRKI